MNLTFDINVVQLYGIANRILVCFQCFAEFAPQCFVQMATALVVTSNWPLFVLWAEWINILMYLFISVFICFHVTTLPRLKTALEGSAALATADFQLIFSFKGGKQTTIGQPHRTSVGGKNERKEKSKAISSQTLKTATVFFYKSARDSGSNFTVQSRQGLNRQQKAHTTNARTHALETTGGRPWLIIHTGQ